MLVSCRIENKKPFISRHLASKTQKKLHFLNKTKKENKYDRTLQFIQRLKALEWQVSS